MRAAAGILGGALLLFMAGVHAYWVAGGRLWKAIVIPQRRMNGDLVPVFEPSARATLTVAAALAAAAAIVASAGTAGTKASSWGAALVALAFAGRVIGDRSYVGVTRTVRDTPFSWRETRIYIPLCVITSALALRSAR